MADIRIDRYEVDVTNDAQTHSITDVGSLDSAFVRIVGASHKQSAGPIGSTSNANPSVAGCGVQITSTNQLTFYKNTSTQVKMMLEVWVYTGSSSGAYEFITRQRGSVAVSGTSNSASLNGLTDRNNVIPFFTGFETTESSTNDYEQTTFAAHVNTSGNIVFSRNNSGTTTTCYYEAVEFTGSAWSVGHAVSTSHDTGNDVDGDLSSTGNSVTMNTDSTGVGGSTFDVSDWSTATIIEASMEGDSSETGLSDILMVVRPKALTTEVRFSLDNSNSRNDGTSYAHILQCDDLSVYRNFLYNFTEGNNSYNTVTWPSGAPTSGGTNVLGLEWFVSTSGEGTAHQRGSLHAQIRDNSGYEIRHWVHRSGNNVSSSYAVIDFSQLEDVSGSNGTATLSLLSYTQTPNNIATVGTATTSTSINNYSLSLNSSSTSADAVTSISLIDYLLSINSIEGKGVGIANQITLSYLLNQNGITNSADAITTTANENLFIEQKDIDSKGGALANTTNESYNLFIYDIDVSTITVIPETISAPSPIQKTINFSSIITSTLTKNSQVTNESTFISVILRSIIKSSEITKLLTIQSKIKE